MDRKENSGVASDSWEVLSSGVSVNLISQRKQLGVGEEPEVTDSAVSTGEHFYPALALAGLQNPLTLYVLCCGAGWVSDRCGSGFAESAADRWIGQTD